jgi:YidC/Oxa1 family membrane protein insertase
MFDFIMVPLGQFLNLIYSTIAGYNYGWTIIFFTIIVRLALMPLTYKQQVSSIEMQRIQPYVKDLQAKYKNDKEKLNVEMMALYKEHGVNPVGSCLPTIIQLPIIIILYQIITRPLSYLLHFPGDVITKIQDFLQVGSANYAEIVAVNLVTPTTATQIDGLGTGVANAGNQLLQMNQGLNFFGLKLGIIPTYDFGKMAADPGVYVPLFLLCIVSVVLTFFSAKLSMASMKKNAGHHKKDEAEVIEVSRNKKTKVRAVQPEKKDPTKAMSNSMLYMGPLITLFIVFTVPAGVMLYWTAGYVLMIIQQLVINRILRNKKVKENANGKMY